MKKKVSTYGNEVEYVTDERRERKLLSRGFKTLNETKKPERKKVKKNGTKSK